MSLSSSIEFEGSIYRNGQKEPSVNGFNAETATPSSTSHNSKTALTIHSSLSSQQRKPNSRQEDGYDEDDDDGGGNAQDVTNNVQPTDRYGFITKSEEDSASAFNSIPIPIAVMRKREKKWLEMLDHWPTFMNKNFDKVKERCRKGVPPSIRPRAWRYLCGAQYYMTNSQTMHIFEQLAANSSYSKWKDDIQKDIFRQFPNHELFSREGTYGKNGQDDLLCLLEAWTIMQPEEGYCQGQAPIAATLLMQMPVKDAFYCFVQICQKYLPGYYSPGLEAIQLDGDILFGLLRKHSYSSYKHLKKQNIDPVLYMVEWFMCAFCRTLPWSTVLRVWDMFFCEGVKVLFKVAIVLFKYGLSTREQLKKCPSMYETVERLKRLPQQIMQEEFLVRKMAELNISDEELERVHYKQTKLRTAKRQMNESARK